MHEARGEGREGMQAVHQVVLNRVRSRKYPSTICGVVLQKYQFSWTADKLKVNGMFDSTDYEDFNERLTGFNQKDSLAYQQAVIVASRGVTEGSRAIVEGDLEHVLHYARLDVQVQWMSSMTAVKRIKNHVFYREE